MRFREWVQCVVEVALVDTHSHYRVMLARTEAKVQPRTRGLDTKNQVKDFQEGKL